MAKTPADAEGKKTTQKDPASQSTQQKEKSSPARALLEVRRSERSPPDRGEGPGAVGGKMLLPQKALEFPGDGGGAMVPTTPGSREPSDLDPDTPPRCEGGRSTPPRERGVAAKPQRLAHVARQHLLQLAEPLCLEEHLGLHVARRRRRRRRRRAAPRARLLHG